MHGFLPPTSSVIARLFLVFFLVISQVVSSSLFASNPSKDFEEIFQQIKSRQLDVARKKIDEAASRNFLKEEERIFLEGLISFELYHFDEAAGMLAEARKIGETQGPSLLLAHTYFFIGRLFKDGFSNSDQARRYYLKAKEVYNELPEASYNLAMVNFQLARTYPLSDIERRVYHNNEAMSFLESNPIQYHIELAECYNLNALTYLYKDLNSRKWKPELLKAINLIRTAKVSDQFNLGKYYDNLGYCLSRAGDFEEGLFYLNLGLESNKRFPFNGYWVTSSLNNIGDHYSRVGKNEMALAAFKEVYQLRLKIYGEGKPEVALALEHIAHTFQKMGIYDSAKYYFVKAIEAFRFKSNQIRKSEQYSLSYAFLLKRFVDISMEVNQQSLVSSLALLKEAGRIVEDNYSKFELENSKIAFIADVRSLFEKRIEVDYHLYSLTSSLQYLEDALESMEFLRYASAFDNQIKVRDSYAKPELKELISKHLELSGELMLLTNLPKDSQTNIRQISQISDQLFLLSDSIKSAFQWKENEPQNIREYVEKGIKEGDAIIEYQESLRDFYMIGITSTHRLFIKVSKPEDWNVRVNQLVQLISSAPNLKSFDIDRLKFIERSYWFYEFLMKPFENLLTDQSDLTIIPDGSIAAFPFDILILNDVNDSYNDLNYLFKKYNLTISLSLRLHLNNDSIHQPFEKVLAFGYTEGLFALPGAKRELDAIQKNFDISERAGMSCNVENFLQESPDYSIIHLAVHGQADNQEILRSRLLFSERDTLFSYQLYSLRLNSPLVVLSSCETAIGKTHDGEGVFSLARSFFLAGASSMIVTLWKTPDHSSAVIFQRFYEFLSENNSSVRSMQLAKIRYLTQADKINAHPFFWAGILPLGSRDSGHLNLPSHLILLLISITFSIIVLLYCFGKMKLTRLFRANFFYDSNNNCLSGR